MNKTNIEWVRNPDGSQGYTWNPITGCLNHDNGLCKGGGFPCYAYKLANGRLKQRYLAKVKNNIYDPIAPLNVAGKEYYPNFCYNDPFYPRLWEEKLYHPWGGKPKGIFVCDMGDLFGIGIPEEWTRNIIDLCGKHEQNRYYLLTKQPQNLIKFSPFPENCWVGVTATNKPLYNRAIEELAKVEAKVKYISFEPLLGNVAWCEPDGLKEDFRDTGINWLIIGACTGTYIDMANLCMKHTNSLCNYQGLKLEQWGNKWTAQPKIEWVREIVEAADRAGAKVFLKDNLRPLLAQGVGRYDKPWAFRNMELRQELPK